jgi:hypothetical protein
MEKKTIKEAAILKALSYKLSPTYSNTSDFRDGFAEGSGWYAKNQSEQMYSEEDIEPLIDFIKDIESNWDCDKDAHKYNTLCRCCEAKKLLNQRK